jgi:uncharacterized protein YbcV (DUF1398 family)
MFTINQIKEAHSKVKSGADFPKYIRDIKILGVISYEHYVSDGHVQYYGINNFTISGDAKWTLRDVAARGDTEKLKSSLAIHQQGKTDYPTFCRQAAEAGVEKWVVDISKMTCIYCEKTGNELLAESIPAV